MTSKILVIAIMLIMLSSTIIVTANVRNNNYEQITITNNNDGDVIEICVAVYTDEEEDARFYGRYGRTRYFIWALEDYSWIVGDTTYRFVPTLLSTEDILKGQLSIENFDAMIYPPDTYDEYLFNRGLRILPRNHIVERNINNFVEQGGGYYGSCGGAIIAGNMLNEPSSFLERTIRNGMLDISCSGMNIHGSIPLFCQFRGKPASSVGHMSVHIMYSGFNQLDDNINYHSGICLDVPVSRDSPIFDDYLEETRRVRWLGAPDFIIPENPDRKIYVLATFPEEEISDNESTQYHYWKYTGGIRGLAKAVIKGFMGEGQVQYFDNLGVPMSIYALAGDWEKTEEIAKTNFSNKPFWIAEIYPNNNEGRIVRCTGHPEHNVWWGGYITEEDTDSNSLYESLYHWMDITPENETIEDEFSYNYWTLRRSIAWAAKVPDNDLPPVYGDSQVSDIYPYERPSIFTINGNVKTADGIVSTELFYRYSDDNSTWTDWASYGIDEDGSDGWSWEFNSPNGIGYYEFYSIRHVIYDGATESETAPPGPDAIVKVVES